MQKKIIFCRIAWMRDYLGATDSDIPINTGQHIESLTKRGEFYTFIDQNGQCRSYGDLGGKKELEKIFDGLDPEEEYIEDVLVIWLADDLDKTTRIVGWYENARVYKKLRRATFFADQESTCCYNIVVNARNSHLVPEEDRTLDLIGAKEDVKSSHKGNVYFRRWISGEDKSLDEIVNYIETYDGRYANLVYSSIQAKRRVIELEERDNFRILYKEGLDHYNSGNYYKATLYLRAAAMTERGKDNVELLKKMGESYFCIYRYDEVVTIFKRVIELEGESLDSLFFLIQGYDYMEVRWRTLKYVRRLLELPDDSNEVILYKRFMYLIEFDILIYYKQYDRAEETIKDYEVYLNKVRGTDSIKIG